MPRLRSSHLVLIFALGHISLGALVAVTEDSPVTVFSLGYSFAL